jgi:predicted nucleic acid-binding protein
MGAHELFCGAYKGQRTAENLARVDALQFEVLDFDREDARQAGELRARLAAAGTPIGAYDVLIAGQALARALARHPQHRRVSARAGAPHRGLGVIRAIGREAAA